MVGRLIDEEPASALAHARAARALGGRVASVREANGLAAYAAGEWAEALKELRTARRLSGEPDHLPVLADCERALGRPDRALAVTQDPQAAQLAPAAQVELLIVAAGARRDLGHIDAAVLTLQVGALEGAVRPWTGRLRYAYADALLVAGREPEARQWFALAAEADPEQETDAVERLLELDGIVLDDDSEVTGEPVDLGEGATSTSLMTLLSSAGIRTPAGPEARQPSSDGAPAEQAEVPDDEGAGTDEGGHEPELLRDGTLLATDEDAAAPAEPAGPGLVPFLEVPDEPAQLETPRGSTELRLFD